MTAFYNELNDRIVSFFILTEVILNINKFIQNYFNYKGTICFIEIKIFGILHHEKWRYQLFGSKFIL